MKVSEMNWRDVEVAVKRDLRCVLPIGSTEQHGHLSLCVDAILAERVSVEAAEPLGIPVFPVMPYGHAPYFAAYPGTVTLRLETLLAVARDVVTSIHRAGFRHLLIVNGHGGNNPVGALAQELMAEYGDISIKFHNWWSAPTAWAKVQQIDKTGAHANWMENFPWTRLAHAPAPAGDKPMPDMSINKIAPPAMIREMLGDGAYGGPYQRPDEEMNDLWAAGVADTRAALEGPWPAFGTRIGDAA
ncbi:creatininase family protein [Rhizobium binxianense]